MLDFLHLPETFVIGLVLAALSVIAVVLRHRNESFKKTITDFRLAVLIVATFAFLAYASITIVPQGKVAALSNIDGSNSKVLSQGLQFKFPWENTKQYDDVLTAVDVPPSRGISIRHDLVSSSLDGDRQINRSYLLADACIRAFNYQLEAGQAVLSEFTCTFGDESFLVLRK